MAAYVFVGPSLGKSVKRSSDVVYLPPARRGDVLALLVKNPDAIGIVDGAFYQSPSVLHKEIIEAISVGIPVFGSSSMGALRAAELECFGMRGIGQIFRWYKEGILVEDDAVALTHGPAELGYPTLTVPIVDILATIENLVSKRLISKQGASLVLEAAKSIHFTKRSWEWFSKQIPALVGQTSFDIITKNWINQKQLDANDLIRTISLRNSPTIKVLKNLPLTTWLAGYYKQSAYLEENLPLRVVSAFVHIVAETFPSVYARTVEDLFLASIAGEIYQEQSSEAFSSPLAGLVGRLHFTRRQAELVISQYIGRWHGATREDVIGAALTSCRTSSGNSFISHAPQRVASHSRKLRNRAGDRSNLLAVVAFLSETEATHILDLARHAVRLGQYRDRISDLTPKPSPSDPISAWRQRFADRPLRELLGFCDARGLSADAFMQSSAIVGDYEDLILRARRASLKVK